MATKGISSPVITTYPSDDGTVRKCRSLELELAKVQREIDLVRGKSECKIQSLEECLERSNLSVSSLKAETVRLAEINHKQSEELHVLQDNIIDLANEISCLKNRHRLMDQELARKDKDAKELLVTVRRYKTRVEYLKSRLKKSGRRRSSAGDDCGGSVEGDESPYNSVLGTNSSVHGSSILGGTGGVPGIARRDSIPFPGYMTSEEEYFRLVVMAAKLNVAGTTCGSSTPTTFHDDSVNSVTPSSIDRCGSFVNNEVHEQDIDAKIMYATLVAEHVPFHKWHEWAHEYVVAHRMPALVGVDSSYQGSTPKRKTRSFAKKFTQKLMKFIPRRKRGSIGIAAGGDPLC
jgi:hypothetical protein